MNFVTKAQAAWGEVPDWVMELALACDQTNQGTVGRRIGRSGSLVSGVLSRTYAGNMDKVEQLVRGALMSEAVDCPVQGRITLDKCLSNQEAGAGTSSPQRMKLGRTCPTCIHARKGGNDAQS